LIVDEYRRSSRGQDVPLPDLADHQQQTDAGLQSKIDKAVQQLPLEQRQAFYLRHELDCSVAEIAAVQECELEAAKSRLRYAYARLRTLLEEATP
jgi:DNA-directed RNA polymerase specialized sigma24 family protein